MGIQSILARSPQAKGRVERLWGTFQDRLVAELRLAGAATLEEANRVLWEFLPRYNARFAVPPSQPGTAYREPGVCLEGVLCFKYQSFRGRMAKDNTVRLGEHTLQLLAGPERTSYTRARVEIQERLDGSLVVAYQGNVIASREAPPLPAVLRARKGAWRQGTERVVARNLEVVPVEGGDQGNGAAQVGLKGVDTRPQAGKPLAQKPGPHHPWRRPLVVTKS